MPSKSIFEDHAKQLEWERDALSAYHEATNIDIRSCPHPKRNLVCIERELRCNKCGMAWSGTAREIMQLFGVLTGEE